MGMSVEDEIAKEKIEVLNPASVRRLKATDLGAGLSFLYTIEAIKAAAVNPLWVVRPI